MGSDLNFVNPPVLPANGSSSQSVTALLVCPVCTIPDLSGWNSSHGRGGGLPASKGFMSCVSGMSGVWPSKAPWTEFPPSVSWVLSQGWATLTGTDPIPACSWFLCHSCGLLPSQGPCVSTCSTSSCRESKATPQLFSPVRPVALPRALQLLCLSPVQRIWGRMPWCALKHSCYANRNRRIVCTLTPSAVSLQTSVKHAGL